MRITEETFRKFAKLISSLAGIELADNRALMLVNRVSARLSTLGIATFEEYYDLVSSHDATVERQLLIDSIATNYTSFFRDESQFAHVRSELCQIFASGQRRIRIWSAACSTGEEAYSLGITALEAAALAGVTAYDVRILATDISNRVLQEAHGGWYSASSIQKLGVIQRTYFDTSRRKCEVTGESLLRVNKQLRDLMIFRNVNLCEQPLKIPSEIDIIFCRNVLLYFNTTTQQTILKSVSGKLKVGGLLYVGASEQIRSHLPELDSVRACVFRKPCEQPGQPHVAHVSPSSIQTNNLQLVD